MVQIQCQYNNCNTVIEDASEAIAIAMYNSHNMTHTHATAAPAAPQRAAAKGPAVPHPILKQDIPAEEWYTFLQEWKQFKKLVPFPPGEAADQLYLCCDRPLARLLLRENPGIVEEGEENLLAAMKSMAVLQVAKSVTRARLRGMSQEHGQVFREFYANVRALASTCEYSIKCTHACCNQKAPIDYTSNVVTEVLINGIADLDIYKEVLTHPDLDTKDDKGIVKLVEEKEIARKACSTNRGDVAALTAYRRAKKDPPGKPPGHTSDESDTSKKLAMKGKCAICSKEMKLFMKYRSGKMNKEAFTNCVDCHKAEKARASSEASAMTNFIDSLSTQGGDS